MPPVLLLVETSKPLVITNGIEGFLQMVSGYVYTEGTKYCTYFSSGLQKLLMEANSLIMVGFSIVLFHTDFYYLELDFHWTTSTSHDLIKLAWNTDIQLGIKVLNKMLSLVGGI